jgi:hypothetical protein
MSPNHTNLMHGLTSATAKENLVSGHKWEGTLEPHTLYVLHVSKSLVSSAYGLL